MTRKDYILIAKVLKRQHKSSLTHINKDVRDAEAYSVKMVAEDLALELSLENPRFDRQRFIDYCEFN